jgi:hypothetical protein
VALEHLARLGVVVLRGHRQNHSAVLEVEDVFLKGHERLAGALPSERDAV